MSGTGVELRWSDQVNQIATASASWPAFVRPASGTTPATTFALYYFSADTTGNGIPGGGTPRVFAVADYMQMRWNINAGTFAFASAPILTAYDDNTHAAPAARNSTVFPNNLSGNTTDTGATARSYLKANAYGFFGQAPGAAPTGSFPTITDGTTGSVASLSGAWTNAAGAWQGLMADVDFITCGAIPTASTQANWNFMLALFSGAAMATGTYQSTVTLKYTYT